jgi:hypothetical protein
MCIGVAVVEMKRVTSKTADWLKRCRAPRNAKQTTLLQATMPVPSSVEC